MAILKYKDKFGRVIALNTYKVNNVFVSQYGGNSEEDVMSQKAVTDRLNTKANITEVNAAVEAINASIAAEVERATTAEGGLNAHININAQSIEALQAAIAVLASKSSLDALAAIVDTKADKSDTYTKAEVDGKVDTINTNISKKANTTDVYTKGEIDGKVNDINTALNTEVSRATTAESQNATDIAANTEAIAAEVQRATTAESQNATDIASNTSAINTEVSRAKAEEARIEALVNTDVATVNASIEAEATRARAAEAQNATDIAANTEAINAEVTRATTKEQDLQRQINEILAIDVIDCGEYGNEDE